jgi:cytoskeletal protein RodZ
MADLGNILQEERKKSGLSLEKTAKILRVKREYLEELENGNFKKLPPNVYVKGFLRNYARLLGLKEKQIIRLFAKEALRKERTEGTLEEKRKSNLKMGCFNWVITPELFFKGAFLVFFIFIVGYFVKISGSFSQAPKLEVWEPTDNSTVAGKEILVKGKTEKNATLKINNQEVEVKDMGEFQATIVLMEGINQIELKATNKFGKESKKQISVNYKSFSENEPSVSLIKKVKIKAESQAVLWSVESSAQNFSGTLEAYGEKELEIKEETRIKVSKGNGVYFMENEGNLEIFGEEEKEVERIFFP